MNCPGCGQASRAGARFCGGCGRPLAPRCAACGTEGQPGARFCDACGASFEIPPSHAAGERKVVSIVFADLAGSTSLHERLDAESTRAFMDRYYRAMQGAVEAHGGTVTQLLGDGVKAVFGAPRVAEDDALRAVRAAVEMQRAFRELASEQSGAVGDVGLRVAVNTGEVVAKDESEIIGDPVNVAARLQQEAHDGDVLIGASTQRLVSQLVTLAPFGTFALKGRAEPVSAYRVVSLERPAGASAIAFVGREDELRRLMAVYEAAVAGPGARLAVVLGSPGLGKSRLLAELGRRLGERASLLLARCDATGGATFAPIAEALRTGLGIEDGTPADALRVAIRAAIPGEDAERARIADGVAALLAGTPASPEETFFVVRRLLTALAATRPVVLAIDDLQWAEPLLLDLTEHLVQWSRDAPLLVLAAARPELREARSSLATPGGLVADVVTLAGLDAVTATRLAASVIGADALPAAIAGRVLATSEGNPLFVGELVRMLVQDGVLKREGNRWTAGVELSALEMPPTIQALLAARIERLRPEERSVLERAAVVGRQFSRAAVAELLPREISDLDARLEALRRSQLIEPDTGWLLGEPVLRFHHVLIRDAAYRRLLKHTRAELHGRFADWLESRVGEAVEHDETIGWHLEQAHQHLRELGPLDARGRALGERASRRLAAAGRRALARDDVPLAAGLLGRALDQLDPADPSRADLALDACEALLSVGEVGAAAAAIDELGRFTEGSDRLRAWHTCFAGELAALTDPQALRATAGAVAAAAGELAGAGDAAGEAKAHSVHASALMRLGEIGACEAALDRALAAARRAGDRRRVNAVLAGAPLAALWGPSPVTRASGRCLDVVRVLRITQGAPAVEAVALRCQGVLEALRGRTDAARRMLASSRRMVEELGLTQGLLETEVSAGLIELIEGDDSAAERSLRAAYEGLRNHGLAIDAARAAARLGRSLLPQGRATEAEALSHESEALAGDDLQAAISWRRVRAEALSRRGEHASAVELASKAVEIAAATDALLLHAEARLALAVALRAAGRSDEADAEEHRAIELWEAKGATLLAERARRGAPRAVQVVGAPLERGRSAHRVNANAATANLERLAAAFAARDPDAIEDLLAAEAECVHHPTVSTYDRQGLLTTYQSVLRVQRPVVRQDPVAALGDSVALTHMSLSATGFAGQRFDVAAYDREELCLIDVDADGRQRRVEFFAPDKLGDAVVRLYERYAELLSDGPERTRAAATARSVAAVLGPFDLDRYATAWTPAIEYVDHRLQGIGPLRGAQTALRWLGTLLEVAEDVANRCDDVLALRTDAFLLRWTNLGRERASGGSYERPLLWLGVFGADGLLTRSEWFDPERESEALARFDELTAAAPAVRPVRRRVRANAAIASEALLGKAVAARDVDSIAAHLARLREVVDHQRAATYDREGSLATFRGLLKARDGTYQAEPLATLGESLALCRQRVSATGVAGDTFDVGAYEMQNVVLAEADTQGRRRTEVFATDRLGDAVARLYERYAELLPEGPERTRAAATARSVAVLPLRGPRDPDRLATAFAPSIQWDDPRSVGFGSLRGPEAVLRGLHALSELVEASTVRVDDILALRSDALLVRWTHSAIDRAGGGPVELPRLMLWVFGSDGLLTRWVQFDADRADEALARFDALTAEAPPAPRPVSRRVRPNAATANAARLEAAVAARAVDAIADAFSESSEVVNHPNGTRYGLDAILSSFRNLLASARDLAWREEPLASLGESLALIRAWISAAGARDERLDIGAFEVESIRLIDVDAHGRRRHHETFAAHHLSDAMTRMYERYAEILPDGPERTRAAAIPRTVAMWSGSLDLDRIATSLAASFECVDHRILGTWSARGAEEFLQHWRAQFDVADGTARDHEVLALAPDALLVRRTWFGTGRVSGGAYENVNVALFVFGADGLLTRVEVFDADRDAEALARFDELTAEPPPHPVRRRVRPNAATANQARLCAAISARDTDALPSLVAGDMEVVHRPTQSTYGHEEALRSWRSLIQARDGALAIEPLATLGDSLALSRHRASASGAAGRKFDFGAWEVENILLHEVDEQGRIRRGEFFADDRLSDAVVRLYERYAELLPEGPERQQIAATARSIESHLGPLDPDRFVSALAPTVTYIDHRMLVGMGSVHGVQEFWGVLRTLFEAAADLANRADDVLAARPDALLVRVTNLGTGRAGGGTFERPFLALITFGADGLITRTEQFDVCHEAEALARFDALTAERPAPRFANAATRTFDGFLRCQHARDWEGVAATFAPGARLSDRRRIVGVDTAGSDYLANLRVIFDMGFSRWRSVLLATRGDRLALFRCLVENEDATAGTAMVEYLGVVEVDASGRRIADVAFDPDDLDAAWAELDARYDAGDAAPFTRGRGLQQRLLQGFYAHDWAALAALFAPHFVLVDHRPLGWGDLDGPTYVESLKALAELSPDAHWRWEHEWRCERGALVVAVLSGTREGGAFEEPRLLVFEHDSRGQFTRHDHYTVDQLDSARARYAELAAALRTPWIENAATRAVRRGLDAWQARDWEGAAARLAVGFRSSDRRRLIRLELDRDEFVASYRRLVEMTTGVSTEVLATRGERLAMMRVVWQGADPTIGPSEIESLAVAEIDGHGDALAIVEFDPDDLDAAYAELDARYAAGEVAHHARAWAALWSAFRAVAARDWELLASSLSPALVVEDHRSIGLLNMLSRDEWVASVRALVDLRPDATLRLDHVVALDGRRSLQVLGWVGDEPEGRFDNPAILVAQYGPDGMRRWDLYDLEQLDAARARFAAIGASGDAAPSDPLAALARPNAATAAMDRLQASFEARDWAAVRALAAEGATFEDRRRHALVSGDADWWLADLEQAAEGFVSDVRYQRRLFTTAGDRVCLERVLWTGGPAGGRVEIEYLWLAEVDESGRLVSGVMFDPEDWRAANRDAWARWLARDAAAAAVMGPTIEFTEGVNDRDRDRMRAVLADDLVSHDRRLTGEGWVEGADAYLDTLEVLWDLSPDLQLEPRFALALERHGMVSVARTFGTLSEGGAWENWLVTVATVARGRITRLELFELEALDAALARLAELGPDPLRIPPNAATRIPANAASRARDRSVAAWRARDWAALRALASPDFTFEDRSKQVLVKGDVEMWIADNQFMPPGSGERELIGTAGDRIALERDLWIGEPDGAPVEIENLRLTEIDAEGRIRAVIWFDPDDRAAAFAEAQDRFVAGEAAAIGGQARIAALYRSITRHDWETVLGCLAEDAVMWDRRALGILGTLDRDQWVESLRAAADVAPDWDAEVVRILAWNGLGRVQLTRMFGTRDGGPFENLYAHVILTDGDRIQRFEYFDVADADRALARFEELCAALA